MKYSPRYVVGVSVWRIALITLGTIAMNGNVLGAKIGESAPDEFEYAKACSRLQGARGFVSLNILDDESMSRLGFSGSSSAVCAAFERVGQPIHEICHQFLSNQPEEMLYSLDPLTSSILHGLRRLSIDSAGKTALYYECVPAQLFFDELGRKLQRDFHLDDCTTSAQLWMWTDLPVALDDMLDLLEAVLHLRGWKLTTDDSGNVSVWASRDGDIVQMVIARNRVKEGESVFTQGQIKWMKVGAAVEESTGHPFGIQAASLREATLHPASGSDAVVTVKADEDCCIHVRAFQDRRGQRLRISTEHEGTWVFARSLWHLEDCILELTWPGPTGSISAERFVRIVNE